MQDGCTSRGIYSAPFICYVLISLTSPSNSSQKVAYPKRNIVLLHSWHHLTATLCYFLSGLNTRPPTCHTSATWQTQTQRVSLRSHDKQSLKCLEFVVSSHRLFLHLIGILPLWTDTTPQCWSTTPNPPTSKMTVKPRRMWRCSILHAVQVFTTVTHRNNGHRPTLHFLSVTLSSSLPNALLCL